MACCRGGGERGLRRRRCRRRRRCCRRCCWPDRCRRGRNQGRARVSRSPCASVAAMVHVWGRQCCAGSASSSSSWLLFSACLSMMVPRSFGQTQLQQQPHPGLLPCDHASYRSQVGRPALSLPLCKVPLARHSLARPSSHAVSALLQRGQARRPANPAAPQCKRVPPRLTCGSIVPTDNGGQRRGGGNRGQLRGLNDGWPANPGGLCDDTLPSRQGDTRPPGAPRPHPSP